MTRPMLCAASVATSSMILLSAALAGAQIVVNSTGDKPNAFPLLTGVCSTDIIERGECTLRAAIQLANFNPDVTTITFNIPTTDSGYNAQTNSWTINVGVNTGLPLDDLSTDINITGPGANVLTVQRDPVATSLRIFKITTATTVSISGLRIKDGIVTGYVGGIENTIGAAVNVNGCTFDGNTANNSRGGGLANASTGNVTLANCLLTQNVATYGGGGIANLSTGTITVINSTLQGNIGAGEGGGGIANLSTGTVMVT